MYKYETKVMHLDKNSDNYLSDIDLLAVEMLNRIEELREQKQISLYPMLSAKDENLNLIGIEQRQNALEFLSLNPDSIKIIDRIIAMIMLLTGPARATKAKSLLGSLRL